MIKRIPRNVWVLSITSFLTDVSSEMLFNLLPLFLVNVLGVRTSVVGLIEGLAETTASLIKLGSGTLSDYLENRKTPTVIGYGLSAIAKPLLYFANTWGWVLGIRFTDRVGKGIRSSPRDALLADSSFDVFFQLHVGQFVLHNQEPLRIHAEITEKPPIARYVHLLPEAQHRAAQRMDDALWGSESG